LNDPISYLELLKLAAPETIIVITALMVLGADLLTMRDLELRFRFIIGALISCVGCVAAIGWMLALPQHANFLQGTLVIDPLTQLVKIGLLALTILTILISIESNFTTHTGEYLALVLLAATGMMFLVSSEDILMIFISLELTSLSLYILTAFNKRNPKSAEAALKYFLFGGMAAAFTLFGLSLLYGMSGSTNLAEIAKAVSANAFQVVERSNGSSLRVMDPLLVLAMVMTVIGFGFKIAAVPFHLWAPDAYEGAPTPSAAFIASGSKLASFFIFAKVMMIGFAGAEGSGAWRAYGAGWVPVLAVIAAISMVLGNLAAIVQSSVRRLLAYSAIAHAGYMLIGVMAHRQQSLSSLVYYAVTYGLTTLGAFGVVAVVEQRTGGDRLSNFAGLSRRAPVLSFCMMIFMLSLAGIPPLAGFFGKFYVFASAINGDAKNLGLLWLVVLAITTSAISLYYYLQVLKQIYILDSSEPEVVRSPIFPQVVLAVVALAVVVLGCAPDLIVGRIVSAIQLAFHR
jgi:NADH-quinone oxidoreductase subunit N